jgi:hypothetical protein
LPTSVSELRSDPPSGWTNKIEQLVLRSMSFSEFEMISNPYVLLTVVSTADADPVAAMQELASIHHTPACFSNGHFDPNIHRVFVLLEDASNKQKDAAPILRNLQNVFPSTATKLLSINSLPVSSPNLQQPDMWSKYVIPKYFPQHAPSIDLSRVLPISEVTHLPILGCRLSGDDFMKLQDFCAWLFSDHVAPQLERRITYLTHQVNESRKGMKNVLKSFWRKPKDESDFSRGGIKYRYDKIETQTMLLADLSFLVKDYDGALSMYRLVKDDYKADKSNLHFAQVLLMISICQLLIESHKFKDIFSQLEIISQCISYGLELPHAATYLALLGSEIYTYNTSYRAPMEAAKMLLVASAATSSRYPLMSSLLVERAASFFLQGNQSRKYVFHSVLAGNKLFKCGPQAAKHGIICFTAAMLILEKSGWADMKTKLAKALAKDLKDGSAVQTSRRAVLFLLKILHAALKDENDYKDSAALMDAVKVLMEIQQPGPWGSVRILPGWNELSTRQVLLETIPVEDIADIQSANPKLEVWNLAIPDIDVASVEIVEPLNGFTMFNVSSEVTAADLRMRDLLLKLFEIEKNWITQVQTANASVGLLFEEWVKALNDDQNEKYSHYGQSKSMFKVSLGEKLHVKVKFINKLPVDVILSNLRCLIQPSEHFEPIPSKVALASDDSAQVIVAVAPKVEGQYTVDCFSWEIGNTLSIRQSVHKQGPLLQKTMEQRADRIRGADNSLHFEVVTAQPLLQVNFEGLSSEILQGQLLKTILVLKNIGAATATNIYLKLSEPLFVFYLRDITSGTGKVLEFAGKSCTLVHFENVVIAPDEEIHVEAWLRVNKPGIQKIHLLAIYYNQDETSSSNSSPRSSFVIAQVRLVIIIFKKFVILMMNWID